VRIRSAVPLDVPSILAIERAHRSAAHWSEEQYLELFQSRTDRPERMILIAEPTIASPSDETSSVFGFLVARHVASEWELENIAVASDAQRRGIGKGLLEALLAAAKQSKSEAVFLEVRESNAAASALYRAVGFFVTGRRKSYYMNPQEDALEFRLDLA
jgi:[ribosomal protein S18]-alanine N-acetyltransferase